MPPGAPDGELAAVVLAVIAVVLGIVPGAGLALLGTRSAP